MLDKVRTDLLIGTVIERFQSVRSITEALCEPLELEDYNLQVMAETSPVKWHLAHTTWFFETFILKQFEQNFTPFHPQYEYLFNSYYNAVGEQFPRPHRHLLSRPTVAEVFEYRQLITSRVVELITNINPSLQQDVLSLVILGINHEQQHQELLLTDLQYNLFQNPMLPAYRKPQSWIEKSISADLPLYWISFDAELTDIGKNTQSSNSDDFCFDDFCFDNELPMHKHYVEGFELSNRLITNGEFIEFIESGGYDDSRYWLSDGWAVKNEAEWSAPLYWFKKAGSWYRYSLNGVSQIDVNQAVTHVSYYEADAFASWKGVRLPTEQEWEHVAKSLAVEGNFLGTDRLEPNAAAAETKGIQQLFGDVWEWTSSSYAAYPGYRAFEGAVGEYNGKFMANQFVLRGGSCVSSKDHLRASYRNFFYPDARWQFSGIRLARSL